MKKSSTVAMVASNVSGKQARLWTARGISKAAVTAFVLALSSAVTLQVEAGTPNKTAQDKAPAKKPAETTAEKTPAKTPEPALENVQTVVPEQVVEHPHEFLNKNIKFVANFHSFTNVGLDYKPAMRESKKYLSFFVLRQNSKIPLSELKLDMPIPKEKDPENQMLISLKDGDQVEVIGKVFSTALDDPWVDVVKLKKLSSSSDDKDKDKDKKTANEAKQEKDTKEAVEKTLDHATPKEPGKNKPDATKIPPDAAPQSPEAPKPDKKKE